VISVTVVGLVASYIWDINTREIKKMNTAKQIKAIPAYKRTKKQKAMLALYESIKSSQKCIAECKSDIKAGKRLMWNTPVDEAIAWVKSEELRIEAQIASLELLAA
jgi:hypothetical protein